MGKYTGTVQNPGLAAQQNEKQQHGVTVGLMKNKHRAFNFNVHWRRVLRKILSPLKVYELQLCVSQK